MNLINLCNVGVAIALVDQPPICQSSVSLTMRVINLSNIDMHTVILKDLSALGVHIDMQILNVTTVG